MQVIRGPISEVPGEPAPVSLPVDRPTLAKRRWRGVAEDGAEFGFDLAQPLRDGAVFAGEDGRRYRIAQVAEPVLEIQLIPDPAPVARLAWAIGNLHFPIEVMAGAIRVPDDPGLRQLFLRERIPFESVARVFQPFARTHGHAG